MRRKTSSSPAAVARYFAGPPIFQVVRGPVVGFLRERISA